MSTDTRNNPSLPDLYPQPGSYKSTLTIPLETLYLNIQDSVDQHSQAYGPLVDIERVSHKGLITGNE